MSIDRRYKVIVWGTGYVGKMVLRELIGHPHFELVGVIVSNPDKDGVDVGELIGRDPIGITCSTDIDAVLAVRADAVAHFGPTAALPRRTSTTMSVRCARASTGVDGDDAVGVPDDLRPERDRVGREGVRGDAARAASPPASTPASPTTCSR